MPAWKDVEEEQERRAEAPGSPEPHRAAARAAAQVWTACASGPRNSSGGGGRMDAARDRQGLRADGAVAAAGSGEPAGGLVGSSGDRRTTRRAASRSFDEMDAPRAEGRTFGCAAHVALVAAASGWRARRAAASTGRGGIHPSTQVVKAAA